ncbi:Hypothetical predicted protein [Mytilus galloprovincialis]|uniref:Uncharacterized protein n=1 Tax=Mytilus galloprovincialis TaxID=29158 RepID=A0A8B6FWI0_MYTGA|nr:Hypothetical predicted protein [Mytilus galloprovincialis]
MVISYKIEKQTYPNYLKFHPKSKSRLNYEAINNNKRDHGTEIQDYDYRVQNATDASKLFLPVAITQYKDLNSCSLSSLSEIIIFNVDIIPKETIDILIEVCSNIRDIWKRCDFTQWDEAKFFYSFKLMEEFVKKLQLTDDEESIVLGNLNRWKDTVNLPQSSDAPRVIRSEIKPEPTSTAYTVNFPQSSDAPRVIRSEIKPEPTSTAYTGKLM